MKYIKRWKQTCASLVLWVIYEKVGKRNVLFYEQKNIHSNMIILSCVSYNSFFWNYTTKKISLQAKRFNVMKLVWDDHWVSFFFFFSSNRSGLFFLTVGISIYSVQQKIPFQFLAFSFISHSIETKQNLSVSKNIKCPYRVAIPSLDLSPSGCGVIHSEYFSVSMIYDSLYIEKYVRCHSSITIYKFWTAQKSLDPQT